MPIQLTRLCSKKVLLMLFNIIFESCLNVQNVQVLFIFSLRYISVYKRIFKMLVE